MASMFSAGLRANVLADAFNVSERTVYLRLAKRGLHYRRPRTRKQQLAIEMRQGKLYRLRGAGLTIPQMAAHLGIQARTLGAWLRRHIRALYEQMQAEARALRAATRPKPVLAPVRPGTPAGPVPLRRWRRSRIKQAYLAGDTLVVIARRYRHHSTTIWRLLRRQGVRLRPRTEHLRRGDRVPRG